MTAPTHYRAGDSASWTETLAAYPHTDGWVLRYRLLSPCAPVVEFAATAGADPAEHVVTLVAADTAAWTPGDCTLVAYVERGPDRHTLGSQPAVVAPDLTTAPVHDGRSLNRRALDDARAALAAHMASGRAHVESYTIAGRSMKFRSVQELRDLIAYYEGEVAKESATRAAYAGVAGGRIFTRM